MDQLTELLNQYSTHGIPENNCNRLLRASSQLTLVPSSTSSSIASLAAASASVSSLTTVPASYIGASPVSSSSSTTTSTSSTTAYPFSFHQMSLNCKHKQHQHQLSHHHQQQQQQLQQQLQLQQQQLQLQQQQQNLIEQQQFNNEYVTDNTSVKSASPTNSMNDELYLEENWRQIVKNSSNLDKKTQGQQDALWELISTEVFYIKRLKVVTDLFLACLISLQCECLLMDIESDKMFSNISDVYAANVHFWNTYLAPMLNASRENGQPLDQTYMMQGFLKVNTTITT